MHSLSFHFKGSQTTAYLKAQKIEFLRVILKEKKNILSPIKIDKGIVHLKYVVD